MAPRAAQLPMWMCDTCCDVGWSPVILSSTVSDPDWVVTLMVPFAVVLTPLSLKANGTGDGVEAGLLATELGDGEDPVSVDPQAAAISTKAASANDLSRARLASIGLTDCTLGISAQVCPRALPVKVTCRRLDPRVLSGNRAGRRPSQVDRDVRGHSRPGGPVDWVVRLCVSGGRPAGAARAPPQQ